MAVEPDTALVERARRGERQAQEALVKKYLRPTYAVALAMVRNASDAEDLAQETLMAALQRLDQCRDPGRFTAWLFQSVRNRALNWMQQNRARASLHDGLPLEQHVETDPLRVLHRQRLLSALEQLSPTQREVVLLHDLQSWTHGEIAEALDLSEVMSRQHLFVARRAMRQHLADPGDPNANEESHHDG